MLLPRRPFSLLLNIRFIEKLDLVELAVLGGGIGCVWGWIIGIWGLAGSSVGWAALIEFDLIVRNAEDASPPTALLTLRILELIFF